MYWTIQDENLPPYKVLIAILLLCVVVFAGGRLHFALTKWHLFETQPWRVFRLSSGGLHAPGAIIGATIGGFVILRGLNLPIGRFVDGFAPAVGIGIALGRLGCFLNGCCYGTVCALPWGVSLSPETYTYHAQIEFGLLARGAAHSLPVHPLPLYFAAVGLALTVLLRWLRTRKRYDGELGLVLIFLFSASSMLLEPLRADHEARTLWGTLPQLFWVALAMTIVSFAALVAMARRHPRRHGEPG